MTSPFLRLSFLLIGSLLHAGHTPYLKKALNKGSNHTIEGIDFIYMINLDNRPEKFARSIAQLAPYDIHPYRFSGINGWALPITTINNVGVRYNKHMTKNLRGTCYLLENNGNQTDEPIKVIGRTYFGKQLSRGALGCILSHLSILNDAYTSGYNRIWVMEDDIDVKKDPHLLSSLMKELDNLVGKDNWDILFTDRDMKNNSTGKDLKCTCYDKRPNFTPNKKNFKRKTKVGNNFIKTEARYGTHSMIIQRSGMKKFLDFFDVYHIFFPYDVDYYAINDINLYTVVDDVVSNKPGSPSDNAKPNC